jgi:tetratricopeptide (TPR) repeat protein
MLRFLKQVHQFSNTLSVSKMSFLPILGSCLILCAVPDALAEDAAQKPTTQAQPATAMPPNQRLVSTELANLLKNAYDHLTKNEYDSAVKILKKALVLDKDSLTAKRYLAYALVRKGQAKEALAQMQSVSKQITPNSFDWFIFGDAYYEAGGLEHAGSCFKEALNQTPAYDAARGGLVKTLVKQNQFNEAVAQVQEGLRYAKEKNVKNYYAALYQGVNQAQTSSQQGTTNTAEAARRLQLEESTRVEKASKPVLIAPTTPGNEG